jgi:hypothetical protein
MSFFESGLFDGTEDYDQADLDFMQEHFNNIRRFFSANTGQPMPGIIDRATGLNEDEHKAGLKRDVCAELWGNNWLTLDEKMGYQPGPSFLPLDIET